MDRRVGVALLLLSACAPALLAAQPPPDSAEREDLALHRGMAAPRPTAAQVQTDAASPAAAAAVEREVREALLAEQRAFLEGDREALKRFLSADPFPFVVDGCMRGDTDALPPCGAMFAKPGKRPRRSTERHDVYALGLNAAYTITHYTNQITRPDGTITRYPSVVTKIWARQGDGWRIVHLHESVAQPPSS